MALNVVKVKLNAVLERHLSADELLASWLTGEPAAGVMPGREGVQAVLFDLDGVLVDTAEFHYQSWKRLADELGIRFDRKENDGFRGVGRMECLERLLGEHTAGFAETELEMLAERKNGYYLEQVKRLMPRDLAVGARSLAMHLRAAGVKMALVSASKNARLVVDLLGIGDWFDAVVDGNSGVKSKPDAEGFLRAAKMLKVKAGRCVVIEDAEAGIRAGHAAGAKCIGVGAAAYGADLGVETIGAVTLELIEQVHLGTRMGVRAAVAKRRLRAGAA